MVNGHTSRMAILHGRYSIHEEQMSHSTERPVKTEFNIYVYCRCFALERALQIRCIDLNI
jgi:hypothetical protein